jgi:hypothetical protein
MAIGSQNGFHNGLKGCRAKTCNLLKFFVLNLKAIKIKFGANAGFIYGFAVMDIPKVKGHCKSFPRIWDGQLHFLTILKSQNKSV